MNEIIKKMKEEFDQRYSHRINNKLIIVINGEGESGKDHLINSLIESNKTANNKDKIVTQIYNISSIETIKRIARVGFNWDDTKNEISRKFLHDLKKASVNFSEFPTNDILTKMHNIIEDSKTSDIIFIHIGEWEEICKLKYIVEDKIPLITLFVKKNKNSKELLQYQDPRFGGDTHIDEYDNTFYNSFHIQSEVSFKILIKAIYENHVLNNRNN